MHILHLSLANFRNYVRLELDLSQGLLVFQGDNAQGKSNLLEAIYLLATTKSPRADADRELINWLALKEEIPAARLSAQVQRARGNVKAEIIIKAERTLAELQGTPGKLASLGQPIYVQKQLRLNGLPRRAQDFLGNVNVVMFSAQDIDLVGGPPSLRRRYLDITASQVDPRYFRALQKYGQVLTQRNRLLRLIQERKAKVEELFFWNKELVETGSYIIFERQKIVMDIAPVADEVHKELTGDAEGLKVSYVSRLGNQREEAGNLEKLAQEFQRELEASLEKELLQGISLVGPHRDDLGLLVDGVDMGVYASRGQQRTVALALKLAEVRYMESKTGDKPILLLDDVLSELDARRRVQLLEYAVSHEQTLLTTTDLDRLDKRFLEKSKILAVRQGNIEVV